MRIVTMVGTFSNINKMYGLIDVFVNILEIICSVTLFHCSSNKVQCPSLVTCITILLTFFSKYTNFKVEHH